MALIESFRRNADFIRRYVFMMSVSLMSVGQLVKEEFVDFKKSIIGHPTPANKLDVNGANVQQTVTLFNGGNKHKSHKPEVINLFQPLMTTMKCFSCLA